MLGTNSKVDPTLLCHSQAELGAFFGRAGGIMDNRPRTTDHGWTDRRES